MKFKIGDKAVHPAHGVGEVTSIEERRIAGNATNFYIIKIVETGMTVMVPTDGADRAGLRGVISKRDADAVVATLKSKEIAVTSQPWNRRYRGFMEKIKTGSLFEVAEVYRDLYRLKSTKVLSFGERRMLDTARNLIVKELAVARKWTEERAEKELEKATAA